VDVNQTLNDTRLVAKEFCSKETQERKETPKEREKERDPEG